MESARRHCGERIKQWSVESFKFALKPRQWIGGALLNGCIKASIEINNIILQIYTEIILLQILNFVFIYIYQIGADLTRCQFDLRLLGDNIQLNMLTHNRLGDRYLLSKMNYCTNQNLNQTCDPLHKKSLLYQLS